MRVETPFLTDTDLTETRADKKAVALVSLKDGATAGRRVNRLNFLTRSADQTGTAGKSDIGQSEPMLNRNNMDTYPVTTPSLEEDEDFELPPNNPLPFVQDDGGRQAAGYRGDADDCVCRAIAIATQLPYQTVYDGLNALGARERTSKRKRGKSHARTGVYKQTARKYMESLGWVWVPTMQIGQGCTVHLRKGEIPMDRRLVVSVSKHSVAVVNGLIHDNHDCSRDGHRCVYGYFYNPKEVPKQQVETPTPTPLTRMLSSDQKLAMAVSEWLDENCSDSSKERCTHVVIGLRTLLLPHSHQHLTTVA